MLPDVHIIDVPIYRCTPDKHEEKIKRSVDQLLKKWEVGRFHEPRKELERKAYEYKRYAWRYNEIVGWINIGILGEQVRGYFWLIKKRITKSTKEKLFENNGKLFEYDIGDLSNVNGSDILVIIKNQIRINLEHHIPKSSFIDFSNAEAVLLLIDWKRLFTEKPIFENNLGRIITE